MTVTSDVSTINACDDKTQWTGNTHSNPDDNTSASTVWIALEPDSSSAHGMSAIVPKAQTGSWHEDTNHSLASRLFIWWMWTTSKQEASFLTILNVILHEGANRTGDNGEWAIPLQPILDRLGGWFPIAVWATQPDVESGIFVAADVSSFELEVRNNDTGSDIKLFGWDFLHSISELRASGTTPTVHDLLDFSDHNISALLGVMTRNFDAYTCKVNMELGLAATTTDFVEINKSLQFLPFNNDQKIGFVFVDPTTGRMDFTLGALLSGNPVDGCSISYDPALTGDTDSSDIFTNPNNCDDFKLYDTVFLNVRDTNLPTTSAAREALGCKWSNCGPVIVSTCKFEDNTVLNSKGAGIRISSTSHNVKRTSFIGCDRGIEFDAAGAYTLDGDNFSGSVVADVENSVNSIDVDSLGTANRDGDQILGDGTIQGVAQSFFSDTSNRTLSNCRFHLSKAGTPTGNAIARLYALSGTIGGGDDIPTGSALATSLPLDVSTLDGTPTTTIFDFEDEVTILSTQDYCIALEYDGGDGTNHVLMSRDASTPPHSGNMATSDDIETSSWDAVAGTDLVFFVNGDGIVKITTTNGANPSSSINTGSPLGTTIIVSVTDLKVTITNQASGLLQGINVRYEESDGTLIAEGSTNASGVFTFSINVALLPLTNAKIIARRKDFEDFSTVLDISISGFDIPISLQPDLDVDLP
jgi:hypothetical protein